jgi:hypothetical protein
LVLINNYVPNNTENRENTINAIMNELKKVKNTVCVDDFNTDKESFIKKLIADNIEHDCSDIFTGGSRSMNGTEPDRLIDYAISNKKE